MWTSIKIRRDTDQANEGTVIATWEADGETFSYSKRVKRTSAGKNAFIASANSSKDTWATERSTIKTLEAGLLTDLNS